MESLMHSQNATSQTAAILEKASNSQNTSATSDNKESDLAKVFSNLGKNGLETLETTLAEMEKNRDTERDNDMIRGFNHYYKAGYEGTELSDVKWERSGITKAEAFAAHRAGKLDRIAADQLAQQNTGNGYVTFSGKDSGLVKNHFSEELSRVDPRAAVTADKVGKVLQAKVVLTDTLGAGKRGLYVNGVIYINQGVLTGSKKDNSVSFAQQIEDWINGKVPKNDSLIIGKTPEIWRLIGMNALIQHSFKIIDISKPASLHKLAGFDYILSKG